MKNLNNEAEKLNEAKHAPGPWEPVLVWANRGGWPLKVGEDEDVRVSYAIKDNNCGPIPLRVAKANAELIAAAPELLAALKAMVELMNVGWSASPEEVAAGNLALAAIEKAEGGAL
jgi:hypothetical protein